MLHVHGARYNDPLFYRIQTVSCVPLRSFSSVFTVERHFLVTEIRNFYALCNSHFLFHSFTQEMSALILPSRQKYLHVWHFPVSPVVYTCQKKAQRFSSQMLQEVQKMYCLVTTLTIMSCIVRLTLLISCVVFFCLIAINTPFPSDDVNLAELFH